MSLLIQSAKNVKNAVTMTQLLYKYTDTKDLPLFSDLFIYFNIKHNYYTIWNHVMVKIISTIKKMKSKE